MSIFGRRLLLESEAALKNVLTTRGDVIRADANAEPERVALGSNGQYLVSDGTDVVYGSRPVAKSVQATTSGTEKDFTAIPSWAQIIYVLFEKVSLSGTDDLLVQLGDSVGFETTNYAATSASIAVAVGVSSSTAGFIFRLSDASSSFSGIMTIMNIDGNIWVAEGSGRRLQTAVVTMGGNKTLSDTLTQVRVTRSGTDTFDAGQVNLLYA